MPATERPKAHTKLFVSWHGKLAREIATLLSETLLKHRRLTPFVSSHDIDPGANWLSQLEEALQSCDYGIACLTPGSPWAPWLNFEAGVVFGRLKRVTPITFETRVPSRHPISSLQVIDGFDRKALHSVLVRLLGAEDADAIFRESFDTWQRKLGELLSDEQLVMSDLYEALEVGQRASRKLIENPAIIENSVFRAVAAQHIRSVAGHIRDIQTQLHVPGALYPAYLIHLLRTYKPVVKALAVVERDEQFWQGAAGHEIRRNTTDASTRIFVFYTDEQLRKYSRVVAEHAHRYNVAILHYDVLARLWADYSHDFSIISTGVDRILALYSSVGSGDPAICFDAGPEAVAAHDEAFRQILNNAHAIDESTAKALLDPSSGPTMLDSLVGALFKTSNLVAYKSRKVEMSLYIPPHEYHAHEEKHAYFVPMMELMIAEVERDRANRRLGAPHILEMGAGTGIFTKRFAVVRSSRVVALEIDWSCFQLLQHTLSECRTLCEQNQVTIEALNEDSRVFDPPGKFDYVVSSFADHHIHPNDKPKYFRNVQRNLAPGAMMIVGDEFLPPHPKESAEARRDALRRYHGHIIEIATREGHTELVNLEQAALDSGLREDGDFKLSCEDYEDLLSASGLVVIRKTKVGPLNRDDVGGIYVYVVTVRQ